MKLNLRALDKLPYTELSFKQIEAIVDPAFVKETRKKLGFNQALFAKLLHVSKKTVEAWEQKVNPIVGGNAIVVYLLHEDPLIATELLEAIPHNGAIVEPKFESFVKKENKPARTYLLAGSNWLTKSDKIQKEEWRPKKWN